MATLYLRVLLTYTTAQESLRTFSLGQFGGEQKEFFNILICKAVPLVGGRLDGSREKGK